MKKLIDKLYDEGFRTKRGKKPVKSRIESLLNDPFYYGAIPWNGNVYASGKHEPLVSKELFDKVRLIRNSKGTPKYQKHQFIFRKLIKCSECEGTITAEIQKGIIYYHCTHYKNCSQKKYTPEDKIEQKLLGVFKFFENITPAEAEQIKAKIKQKHTQEIDYKENTIKTLNDRYGALQRRLDNLYNDRLDEKISPEFWQKKHNEISEEQNELKDKLTKLKNEEARYFEIWLNILDLARRAKEIYEKRSPEQRRLLLTQIFSNLMLKDDIINPTLKKPIEILAKRVQQKIDSENTFELNKDGSVKRQKDSFESLCPALLRRQGSNL
jgi:site-specific DNA recombinase